MFSIAAIKGKINRSGISFQKTFLWKNRPKEFSDEKAINLLLGKEESIIVFFIKSENYKWIMTNKRLFIPDEMITIFLKDIIEVDFDNLKENPEQKLTNTILNIHTKERKYFIYLEDRTWHLFYDIFNFIIINNKKK